MAMRTQTQRHTNMSASSNDWTKNGRNFGTCGGANKKTGFEHVSGTDVGPECRDFYMHLHIHMYCAGTHAGNTHVNEACIRADTHTHARNTSGGWIRGLLLPIWATRATAPEYVFKMFKSDTCACTQTCMCVCAHAHMFA